MAHWLEEAEQESKGRKKSRSAGFLDRKMRIENNYTENAKAYDAFIHKMEELINRVNSLPLEKKQPFGNIDSKPKHSKLENHQHIFKSSRRYEKKVFRGSFWDFVKPKHMKHVRILTITVSSQHGKVGFDIRDEAVLKEKVVVDKDLVKQRKKYKDSHRYHEYLNYDINNLDESLALKIIDWLAFKVEVDELPFVKI